MPLPAGERTFLPGATWGATCVAAGLAAVAAVVALSLIAPLQPARSEDAPPHFSGPARAMLPPRLMIGEWQAILVVKGRPQPVRLEIHAVEPGQTAGKLTYSRPRDCTVDLQYGGPDGARHIFYMVPFTNCFRYGKDDYVALSRAEDLPSVFSDLSEDMPVYRSLPRRQRADAGTSDAAEGAAEPLPIVKQISYEISLGDREIETGLLARR